MAITLDNSPVARSEVFSNTTLTWSFTRAAGSGVLFVGVINVTADIPTSVTYNGEALTLIHTMFPVAVSRLSLYRLRNPAASGANNIVVTFAISQLAIIGNGISFSGDSESAVNMNPATAAAAMTLDNPLTISDQSWIVITGMAELGDVTAGTNVTSSTIQNPLLGRFGPRAGAGSTTMTINRPAPSDIFSIVCEIAVLNTPAQNGQSFRYRSGSRANFQN